MERTILLRCIFVAFATITLLATGGAFASTSESSNEPEESAGQIQQVVVTARRREESEQQVPIAMTVITPDEIQRRNIQTLTDIQFLVPSLSIVGTGYKEGTNFVLRGQGSTANGPGVIIFVDEVPAPPSINNVRNAGGPGFLFDLENVQVLKGPQGTLFGLNSMGGDVLMQTARPTKEFGGNVQASYGNHNDREVNGAINAPIISDVLLTRVAFTGQWRDGYSRILSTYSHPDGVDSDNRDTWGIRGSVSFTPSDRIHNDLVATYSSYKSYASPAIISFYFPGQGLTPPQFSALIPSYVAEQQQLGIRTGLPVAIDNITNGTNLLVTNTTHLKLTEHLEFKNIIGYGYAYQYLELDQGGIPGGFFDFPLAGGNPPKPSNWYGGGRQYSEEAQLVGSTEKLQWVAGLFYLHFPLPGYSLQTADFFGTVDASQSLVANGARNRAAFTQATYELLPDLRLTAGVRYTKDDRYHSTRGGAPGSICYGAGFANCGLETQVDLQGASHALTWTFALDYQLTPENLLYATSRRGYASGGFNANTIFASNLPGYGPEYVTDFEVGTKSDWHVGTVPLRTNVNFWYQDWTDIQFGVVNAQVGGYTTNAGKARLYGSEVEVLANLTENLQVGLNYDYLRLEYTKFDPGVSADTAASAIAEETMGSPENKYGINARYRLPLPSTAGELSARTNWSWQSTQRNTLVPQRAIPAYGLLGASVDWNRVLSSSIDISLFGSNLLNKDYVASPMLSFEPVLFGFGTQLYGEPRMYGIRLKYHFGAESH